MGMHITFPCSFLPSPGVLSHPCDVMWQCSHALLRSCFVSFTSPPPSSATFPNTMPPIPPVVISIHQLQHQPGGLLIGPLMIMIFTSMPHSLYCPARSEPSFLLLLLLPTTTPTLDSKSHQISTLPRHHRRYSSSQTLQSHNFQRLIHISIKNKLGQSPRCSPCMYFHKSLPMSIQFFSILFISSLPVASRYLVIRFFGKNFANLPIISSRLRITSQCLVTVRTILFYYQGTWLLYILSVDSSMSQAYNLLRLYQRGNTTKVTASLLTL